MIWIAIVLLCVVTISQFIYIRSNKKKIRDISYVLDDVVNGNLDRRLLANEETVISDLVYKMNEIIIHDKNKLIETEKSEKAYKELVTSLSHDIRTPLASLVGYLEVLESDSCSPEEQKNFLMVSKTKALNLSEYIQALFEWLKLESGEWIYHYESENICELTRIILADWIIKLEKNKIDFHFDIPEDSIFVVTDKNAFQRIVNNLLSNMLKHSGASLLTVTLTHSTSEIVIMISDNGVGIAEQDLPFIFDRLYKCDTSRTNNSNGLGLAIVKELLTALGGEISAKSTLNDGATFLLKLPYKHK